MKDDTSPTRRRRSRSRSRKRLPCSPHLLAAAPILLLFTSFTSAAASTIPIRLRHEEEQQQQQQQQQQPQLQQQHSITLAPCAPLPVETNCSAVPAALEHNMASCTHISFQPGGYGQEAQSTTLRFSLDDKVDQQKEGGGALTMVLLLGSVFYFPNMDAMYAFMRPKVRAAMEGNGLYDPTLEGPCTVTNATTFMAVGMEDEDGMAAAVSQRRRRHGRRRVQGGGGGGGEGDLPTCADVMEAFNAEGGGMGEDAETYAHLYACNITASGGNEKMHHQLSYDGLIRDFPYSYYVFLNIGPGPQNQTIVYTAEFSPTYKPASTRLAEPLFAFLLLAAAVYFVVFSRYVSNPALDWLSSTRWGKRCLRGSRC